MAESRVLRRHQELPVMTGLICGVDEAGRGPLAGPVYAAAVILDPQNPVAGLADSKKLSAKRRDELARLIRTHALAWSVAQASAAEVDELNILQASLLAMKRAVETLSGEISLVLVDGCHLPKLNHPAWAVVGGDDRVSAISAASILAKTERDHCMEAMALRYPQYQFERHKGYPSPLHLELLREHGPCPEHRRSFGPVRALS
jgi:ribonuclease HII